MSGASQTPERPDAAGSNAELAMTRVCPVCRAAGESPSCDQHPRRRVDLRYVEASDGDPLLGVELETGLFVTRVLGSGQASLVYEAELFQGPAGAQPLRVAVKVRREAAARDFGLACAALEREYQWLGLSQGVGPCPRSTGEGSFDAPQDPALPRERFSYLVMERIEADAPGPPEPGLIALRARWALEALAELHGRGLIHGDIKPEHLRFPKPGSCRLLDFSAARALGDPGPPLEWSPAFQPSEPWEAALPGVDLYAWGKSFSLLLADPGVQADLTGSQAAVRQALHAAREPGLTAQALLGLLGDF